MSEHTIVAPEGRTKMLPHIALYLDIERAIARALPLLPRVLIVAILNFAATKLMEPRK